MLVRLVMVRLNSIIGKNNRSSWLVMVHCGCYRLVSKEIALADGYIMIVNKC